MTLTLSAPALEVHLPPWLFASTHRVRGLTGLVVYRSVDLRDTSPRYSRVREFLSSTAHQTVSRIEVVDETMMFGRAECAVHLLDPAAHPLPASLIRDWTAAVRAEFHSALVEAAV